MLRRGFEEACERSRSGGGANPQTPKTPKLLTPKLQDRHDSQLALDCMDSLSLDAQTEDGDANDDSEVVALMHDKAPKQLKLETAIKAATEDEMASVDPIWRNENTCRREEHLFRQLAGDADE